jgi:hypothetical protein
VPAEMLTRDEKRVVPERPHRAAPTTPTAAETRTAKQYAEHVRRLKRSVVAWVVWTVLVTALWVTNQWDANGAFESFGHEGNPGQWNPTLWAVGIAIPTLIVGVMALGVYFVRRPVWFHISAWLFGMAIVMPLWALIEWQDNGGFERWSNDSQPGNWDPWFLAVGGIWALSVLLLFGVRRVSGRSSHGIP